MVSSRRRRGGRRGRQGSRRRGGGPSAAEAVDGGGGVRVSGEGGADAGRGRVEEEGGELARLVSRRDTSGRRGPSGWRRRRWLRRGRRRARAAERGAGEDPRRDQGEADAEHEGGDQARRRAAPSRRRGCRPSAAISERGDGASAGHDRGGQGGAGASLRALGRMLARRVSGSLMARTCSRRRAR